MINILNELFKKIKSIISFTKLSTDVILLDLKKDIFTDETKKEKLPNLLFIDDENRICRINGEYCEGKNENGSSDLMLKLIPIKILHTGEYFYFSNLLDMLLQPPNNQFLDKSMIKIINYFLKNNFAKVFPENLRQLQNSKLEDSLVLQKYMPMLHGKATDAIANMSNKKLNHNVINNTASICSNDTQLVISNFDKLAGTLGVSTHKLLSKAVATFTSLNNIGNKKRSLQVPSISFPLKEYALMCGYDVLEHETSSKEEAEAEAKRAKSALDNARKKIRKDLNILFNSSISWEEKVRGKNEEFANIHILGAVAIKRGNIFMEFTHSMANYLIQLPITQFPSALLKLDERNNNAYIIGLKMAEHFSMNNNQIRGTAKLLKVSTLLKNTSLPSINSSGVVKNGWSNRIKEPFENALDILTNCGLLKDWKYVYESKNYISDKQSSTFLNYEHWSNSLVKFTLADNINSSSRLEFKNSN